MLYPLKQMRLRDGAQFEMIKIFFDIVENREAILPAHWGKMGQALSFSLSSCSLDRGGGGFVSSIIGPTLGRVHVHMQTKKILTRIGGGSHT
jgi:hypothetical protein